ncbi:hypothetical protein QGW_2593 [Clostridioides difficile 824]|nr:hypothetical protein QCI_2453 [Clostridioides difficile CD44]EQF88198.1 hypothetical protein QGW_2593 [Clostridioides difficile 824]EQJ89818.1 hypothetical protein QUA_2565 [Clostridioides difficile P49]ERM47515.1 hypothetical protein QUG_2341 [Clostridioides difficile P53]
MYLNGIENENSNTNVITKETLSVLELNKLKLNYIGVYDKYTKQYN